MNFNFFEEKFIMENFWAYDFLFYIFMNSSLDNGILSLFQYTMDSSNKDITVNCNLLIELVADSYTGDIVLLVFCNI